jgi:hypothetical protein
MQTKYAIQEIHDNQYQTFNQLNEKIEDLLVKMIQEIKGSLYLCIQSKSYSSWR